jgi:hypothetical protein
MLKVLPWRITLEAGTSPLASIGVELSADGRPYGVSFDGGKLAAGDCSYVSTYLQGWGKRSVVCNSGTAFLLRPVASAALQCPKTDERMV